MIDLDHGLIRLAKSLATEANVRRGNKMIVGYQQAVRWHNKAVAGHETYQKQFEEDLRRFTRIEAQKCAASFIRPALNELADQNKAVMDNACAAIQRSQNAHAACEELDQRVNYALSLGRKPADPEES